MKENDKLYAELEELYELAFDNNLLLAAKAVNNILTDLTLLATERVVDPEDFKNLVGLIKESYVDKTLKYL